MIYHRLFSLVLTISLALLPLLESCHHGDGEYDIRLCEADNVLNINPDSAMALLRAVEPAQLTKECDYAYYALLMTQTRYRCYICATNDSLINIAVNYYMHHDHEVEKLTRAYIYKGAVMEELGETKQAIAYYKQAASVVSPIDYFNQGYIRLRIANIYRDHLVADSMDFSLFKEAYGYFRQHSDTSYMIMCLGEMGLSHIKTNRDRDSILPYLTRAIDLAKEAKAHELEYKYKKNMAEYLMFSKNPEDIDQAKLIALSIVNDTIKAQDYDDLLMLMSFLLAKQNKPDSANYYLKQVDEKSLADGYLVFYDLCQAEIARSQGDVNKFKIYHERADALSDSLENDSMQRQLREVEAKYDNEALKNDVLRYRTKWIISLLVTSLALSILVIVLMLGSHKLAKRRLQLKTSEDIIERLQSDRSQLINQLADNEAMNEELKSTIRHQIDTFTNLVEMHWKQFTQHPKKFGELFRKSYSMKHPDKSFWAGINAYADSTCSGIITRTLVTHNTLAEDDVRFLALCCCDLPTTVIMACMGYNDVHSVYNKRRRVAQELSLTGKLEEYIAQFKPDVQETEFHD